MHLFGRDGERRQGGKWVGCQQAFVEASTWSCHECVLLDLITKSFSTTRRRDPRDSLEKDRGTCSACIAR